MSTKIIYHQIKPGVDCPDGLAAAWVARRAYPDAQIIGCWYQCTEDELPVIEAEDLVIIVDFSFPPEIVKRWESVADRIVILDHHKTAREQLGGIEFLSKTVVKIEEEECGATLAWKHFFPNDQMPAFLHYIKDRDLWNFNYSCTEGFHEICAAVGRSFELFDFLASRSDSEIIDCISPFGDLLLIPKRKQIAEIAQRARIVTLPISEEVAYLIPFVELAKDGSEDRLVSDVCASIYKDAAWKFHSFVLARTSDGTFSLRSNKNNPDGGFDVSEIARAFGGGGHRNAAGFKADLSLADDFQKEGRP